MKTKEWVIVLMAGLMSAVSTPGLAQRDDNSIEETPEDGWSSSFSVSTYLAQHGRDFANPVVSADHGGLHLEARYNYEALKTGSVWAGYNLAFGNQLAFEATPMLGLVFGDSTGLAPGYNLVVSYGRVELFTQGEYFFDAGTHSGNFFYSWSELSYAPADWVRFGMVVDRTKVLGSGFDVRRGPLLGFSHKAFDFTTYWLDPGSTDATFVFSVTLNF
jgi:hypothetical protein